jgi:hypothetical protein
VVGAMLPAFLKRIVHRQSTYLPDFKTGEIVPCQFLKALGTTPRDLLSNSGKKKDLNSPVLKSFQQIQKLLTLND